MRHIQTDKAPAAIGPYSQAVQAGDFLFISGQIPINPATGELVSSDVQSEAKQVMENLKAILESVGKNFDSVVKSTIFLRTMDDFITVNNVYGAYFKSAPPARETVAVAGLPKNVNVEISMMVFMGD